MLVSNLDPTLFFLLDLDSVFLLVTDLDPVGAGFFCSKVPELENDSQSGYT